METISYSLRQFLKCICRDLQWDYAVFWKLKHPNRILLAWEDGYCDHPKPRTSVEGLSHSTHSGEKTGETSFNFEIDVTNGNSVEYPIELAVASMSCLLYSFGEGHVGKVASTGKHCWISADEFDSKSHLEIQSADELHLQFAVGIKTILLVPVIPHGVVHLGSLRKVNEDPALVAHIRGMFHMFQHNSGGYAPSSLNEEIQGAQSSVDSSLLKKMTAASSIQIRNPLQSNMQENDSMAFNDTQAAMHELSDCSPEMMLWFADQDNFQILGNNTSFVSDTELCSALSFLQPQLLSEFSGANNSLEKTEVGEQNFCYQEGYTQLTSQCVSSELGVTSYGNLVANVYPVADVIYEQFPNESGEVTDQINSHGFLNFSTDSELHKALGPALQKTGNEYQRNMYDFCADVSNHSLIYPTDFLGDIEPLVGQSYGFTVQGGDEDNLLDVMVSTMYDTSADISSTRSNSTRSPTISSGQIAAACQTRSRSSCSVLGENDAGPWDSITDFVSRHEDALTRSPSKSPSKSSKSSLVIEEQHKEIQCAKFRKSTKLSHIGQKRPRESDVQKPRPRDRQLIQDRVKELRELVPNSAKCSIDSLLDQTVNHMLFLRSITNRAERLKQCLSTEGVNRRKCEPSENQGPGKGASWAYEVGSQFEVCPIVVKDLEQPGHMLIEMLCEETVLFLEIAQVIRGLDLTIVKGVTENRLNKPWAQFVVEASTGFRRMDIFWPLMKLLQRNSSVHNIPFPTTNRMHDQMNHIIHVISFQKSPLNSHQSKGKLQQNYSVTHSTNMESKKNGISFFQMPLHYPRYSRKDYEDMPEWKIDRLLGEYGLPAMGDLANKRNFAMGAFLWSDEAGSPQYSPGASPYGSSYGARPRQKKD